MLLTDHEIATLRDLALLCPPGIIGAEGYPDPRPLEFDVPTPAYLWLVAELALRNGVDPWRSTWTGGKMKRWALVEANGLGREWDYPDLPSVTSFAPAAWTPEVRERQVRALIRALGV